MSLKELKYMLLVAEKEIGLKDKRISSLEKYVTQLEDALLSGKQISQAELDIMRGKVKREALKIEKQIMQFEETKQAIANTGESLKLEEALVESLATAERKTEEAKGEQSSEEE